MRGLRHASMHGHGFLQEGAYRNVEVVRHICSTKLKRSASDASKARSERKLKKNTSTGTFIIRMQRKQNKKHEVGAGSSSRTVVLLRRRGGSKHGGRNRSHHHHGGWSRRRAKVDLLRLLPVERRRAHCWVRCFGCKACAGLQRRNVYCSKLVGRCCGNLRAFLLDCVNMNRETTRG